MIKTVPHNHLCSDYAGPLRRLLFIGKTRNYDPAEWPDYATEFGLRREHIPELIRLACDAALNWGDPESREVWAPLHAWRALGQLQAEASVVPLLAFLKTAEGDEAVGQDFPMVFGMIGPAAIPHIAGFLSDRSNPRFPVSTAIEGLKEIAERHPECRAECVGILARTLEWHAETDRVINGFAVSALIDLAAVEVIDTMREAFRRKSVDISIAGDEEDVEIALGLRDWRSTPAPFYHILPTGWLAQSDADRIQRDTHAVPRHSKVGRNDPCPCGSGRKYKKCCLQ
jgi:SEC-C motif